MLECLKIKNFQTHKSLIVPFGEHVTTIVGPSDCGKSAVLRALRWVCFNQPNGKSFIRDGADFAKAQVTVDGHTVTRIRGKTNRYVLDGKDLVSFGVGVPDPVASLLNMGPDNFQRQHDPAFWFSDSPGEVSRKLNTIIDLGIIDTALTHAGREVRRANATESAIYTAVVEAQEEKELLSFVPDMEEDWRIIRTLEKKLEAQRSRIDGLSRQVTAANYVASRCDIAGGAASGARSMLSTGEEYGEVLRAREALALLLWPGVGPPDTRPVDDMGPLGSAYDDWMRVRTQVRELQDIISNTQEQEEALCQRRSQLREVEKTLPNICPTCGKPKSGTTTK